MQRLYGVMPKRYDNPIVETLHATSLRVMPKRYDNPIVETLHATSLRGDAKTVESVCVDIRLWQPNGRELNSTAKFVIMKQDVAKWIRNALTISTCQGVFFGLDGNGCPQATLGM